MVDLIGRKRYIFIRENNGLNKYIFIVDFGERKIIIIKKYYYYY